MHFLVCAKCGQPIQGQAVQGPAGWMHPPCAGGSGSSSVVPLVVALGCAVPGALVVLVMIFLAIWQFLSPATPVARADGGAAVIDAGGVTAGPTDALTERYESGNGMLTARYPASFAASKEGASAVTLMRPYPDGNVAVVVLEAVEKPVSTDVRELDRLLVAAETKLFKGYVVRTKRPTTCHGEKGLLVTGSFTADNGAAYERRSCRFLAKGHFYSFAYSLPQGKVGEDATLMEVIVEATEMR